MTLQQQADRLISVPLGYLRALLLLATLLFPLLLQAGTSAWQDKRYIERSFYDIALNAEYRSERVPPVVKRWMRPLRVWMYSGAGDSDAQRSLLEDHLRTLGEIARLSVKLVDDRRNANVRVYFASERELNYLVRREMPATALRQLPHSQCLGSIRFNKDSEIVGGTVVIPVERATASGKLAPCVVEEVTQMLGLINDSEFARDTVFSDVTQDERLTGLDYLLIKLLYSPHIEPGMSLREAMPAVRRQLDIWESVGYFQRLEQRLADRRDPEAADG